MIRLQDKIHIKLISIILTQAFLITGIAYPQPVNKQYSLYISAKSLRVPMMGSNADADNGQEGSTVHKASRLTRMSTLPGRLIHSLKTIAALSLEFVNKPVIYDIGIGWFGRSGPIVTIELSDALSGKAKVIGIDSQIPYFAVHTDKGTILFSAQNEIISIQDPQDGYYFEPGDTLSEGEKRPYIKLAQRLRKEAEESGSNKEYSDPAGNKIVFNPIHNYEKENLSFIKGDLFELDKIAGWKEIPKAHIVRIANLLIPYFQPGDITPGLRSLLPMVHDNGYVLVGYSHQSGKQEEEYLVYRKRGNKFKLESYMFSINGADAAVGISAGKFKSPAKEIYPNLLREYAIRDWPEQRQELYKSFVDSGAQPYYKRYGSDSDGMRKANEEFDKTAESYAQEIAVFLAKSLTEQGIFSRPLGSMVEVRISRPAIWRELLSKPMATRFMGYIETFYLDKGIPSEVIGDSNAAMADRNDIVEMPAADMTARSSM
ncbi:MAG: hypothetical protein Q8O12_00910 [Candidatus Omnitrophota bacterium]|nr:hypothetical protein [Candidatus Omnitrophota bacterium]